MTPLDVFGLILVCGACRHLRFDPRHLWFCDGEGEQ